MIPLRRLVGGTLRRQRQCQGRTLREVSAAARVSLGYLSEVERGQKEPSSELFAAICVALNVPMSAVLREVSDELALVEAAPAMPSRGEAVPAVAPSSHAATPASSPAPAEASASAARTTAVHDLVTSAPFRPPMPTPMPGDGVAVGLAV